MEILWVLPDYYEEMPKPCMGGWAHDAILVQPNGDVLPCQAAATIPGLRDPRTCATTRWRRSGAQSELFNAFRGTDWMQEPCRSCPLNRQHEDFGGCRCQALALTGDAAATDPVCQSLPASRGDRRRPPRGRRARRAAPSAVSTSFRLRLPDLS